ncbi:ROK family protein [Mucilaginibacter sp. X5P1]|uniref:ROK family protein n=1 Tax=Mucilaginibacter sp. X5P1 TaxID=2723088 RepID=UPI00161576E0|nr:ROK family protein [Mucilaginibacter sp. X5P1]MBB6141945.1 glucokinase [Mucilaginibacter sp. X5P1]
MIQINGLLTPYVLTADIGGSHITSAICNIETSTIIPASLTRIELSSKGSAANILKAWERAFQLSISSVQLPVSALGLAMPGPFDYEKGISYIKGLNKYEALYEMNIKQYLADVLKLDPALIRFRNDAEATIAGEVLAGAGKDFQNVMGITLGTGFGSAQCLNGVSMDLNLGSSPFKNSIADDHLSTRWFLKRYTELSGVSVQGVKELALLAVTNNTARQIFKEFALNMGGFLYASVQQLNPDVLVICGNIAKASNHFLPHLKKQLPATNIQFGQLSESAALIGAAGLFPPVQI